MTTAGRIVRMLYYQWRRPSICDTPPPGSPVVFDPEAEAFLRLQAKAELRRQMRALRAAIPEKARAARSERIVERIVQSPELAAARGVGLFWPMLERNEVDVRPIDAAARAAGKPVAYPFMRDEGDMTLLVAEPAALEERGNSFAEPPEDAPEIASDGLLVIVPALAVDEAGHRIGYGKGFYDRLLARIAPPARAIAVAYDFQVVAEVPATEHDRPVDIVVTDARVLFAAKPAQP
jgi:5-formyltetrahydrofolate cyclo-ligase